MCCLVFALLCCAALFVAVGSLFAVGWVVTGLGPAKFVGSIYSPDTRTMHPKCGGLSTLSTERK